MERFKRAVSLVLCMVMVLGLLPVSVFAATGTTRYLMFATDRHANTSIIGNIINNMETTIGENKLEYLALGGDMVGSGNSHPAYNSSEVLGEVTGATTSLSAANVDIVAGIHDMNVTDDAGIVLKYQSGGAQIYAGDGYYVYGVEEYCISEDSNEENWSTQAQAFADWANGDGIDKSAVIFVSSHYPLHANRDDNDGAYYWHQALNSVATGGDTTVERDIVFFHGHNHTVDGNEYVYNVGETMSIQNVGSTVSDTIYYTYATAGYLNQNSKATLVTLTDEQIVLQKYTTSGSGTAMTTVTRAVTETAPEETTDPTEETTEPTEGETTDPTETTAPSEDTSGVTEGTEITLGGSVTTSTEKTVYVLVDEPENGEKYVIVSNDYALVNSNGSASGVAVTDKGSITINGTTYDGYIELDNSNAVWTAGTGWTFKNGSYYLNYSSSSSGSNRPGESTSYSVALSTSSADWTYNTDSNYLYFTVQSSGNNNRPGESSASNYYVYYGSNGWSLSSSTSSGGGGSSRTVYFYKELTYTESTTVDTTVKYTMRADDLSVVVPEANVTGTLAYCLQGNGADLTDLPSGGEYSFTVLSDENGIISGDIASDGTVTFSGTIGEATVKVAYTWIADDGITYTVYKNVTVTAEAPVYSMAIADPESTLVKIGNTTTLSAVADMNGTAIEDAAITWSSSDESIATVDASTGVVTGVAEGDVTITATWTDPKGVTHTDTVDLTVVEAVYTLDICKEITTENEDGTTTVTYESITKPIVIKNVDELVAAGTNTHSVWAVITKDGEDMGALTEEQLENLIFVSSDESIATVDKTTGVVTFTGKEGTVQITAIYTYADGKSVTDTVTFSISKETYTIPSDGTDDFPTYPEEGAIRFDKNAVAQGNFSETGIAKVELSMTGVPYTTGNAIDVLLMIDMSTSMDTEVADGVDRVEVTITAAKAFAKTIVQNSDGTYNTNKIAIKYFNGSSVYTTTDYITVSSDSELEALYTLIEGLYTPTSTGTYYSVAMESAYNTVVNQDAVSDNTQALVFMSDGGPTYYTYLNDSGTGTTVSSTDGSTFVGWFDIDDNDTSTDETDDTATPNSSFKTEYYSYLLKQKGYPVYTVGLGLSTNDTGPSSYTGLTSSAHEAVTSYILSSMATSASYFYNIADEDAVDDMDNIFTGIAASIKEAATDVVVEDKIEEHYTMNFKLPNTGVTAEEAEMSEFYIQVVDYILDSTTHERTGNYSVLENITFNTDGSVKSHTVDGVACGDSCTHVTFTDGTVTAIDGTYFDYTIDANGDEFLTWNAEKLTSTELALQYFVYLDESAGHDAADQVDAGTYNTNEYATITYTNHLGNRCQQYFPIPSMTWMGAQVTYVFYLVNDQGQPVNRAGVVVPFAEAVYVTQPYTYDVTWNEEEGIEKLDAKYLAANEVPDVYKLYDEEAYYEILVYQTEGVDEKTSAVNYNHFIIEGSSTVTNKETTKVFNTKAGTKYDDYGAYSATSGSYTSTNSGKSYTATVTNDIDYANTTVAFAVTWTPKLAPDTVVVDFGLDVIIDVTATDSVAASVVGVRASAPSGVTINTGTYAAAKAASADVYIDANHDADGLQELKLGTATVESLTSVRFSLDETDGMQFSDPAKFYYEAEVNFYDENNTLKTSHMYSSVTVIPATTIYYEDDFLTLKSYNMDGTEQETSAWENPDDSNAVQAQDRPGASKISEAIDADNNYGYDAAYASMSQFSLDSSAKITVDANTYGTAQFSFYGTGFDVISLTSNETGNIVVNVAGGPDNINKYYFVDTYYGYARGGLLCNTYTFVSTEEGGEWKLTGSEQVADPTTVDASQIGSPVFPADPEVNDIVTSYEYEWVAVVNDPNALYQVPVMKIEDLKYGKYDVTITASYVADYDHANDGSYDFYLDAIRIYDPANDGANNEVIADAYKEDHEYLPEYYELRNWLISANSFNTLGENEEVEGIVFIDGAVSDGTTSGAGNTASVTDYSNFGPNNELYLAPGQAVAFNLNAGTAAPEGYEVDTVQIAYKSVGGTAKVKLWDAAAATASTAQEKTVATATDLYYDITALNGKTVVILNSGETADDAILSITNVKVTFKEAAAAASEAQAISGTLMRSIDTGSVALMADSETEAAEETAITAPFTVTANGVASAIAAMTAEPEEPTVPETTVPEETEPETTVPEETVPETTVPEETEPETTVPEETEPEEPTVPEETEPEEPTVPEETEPEEPTVPEETEPETFEPTLFNVRLNKTTVKVGQKVLVTVTTSSDVDYITINGSVVTTYSTGSTGNRTWKLNVTASAVGTMNISTVCYDSDDVASDAVVKQVTVQKKNVWDYIWDLLD